MSKYKVNGEGWEDRERNYRIKTDDEVIYISSASLVNSKILSFDYDTFFKAEQRYTDQQIELLQRDEGWIVIPNGPWTPPERSLFLDIIEEQGAELSRFSHEIDWPRAIAYRLTTNDLYIKGKRIELREGDYIEHKMNMKDSEKAAHIFHRLFGASYREFDHPITTKCGIRRDQSLRKLTLAQVLNAENAKPKENVEIEFIENDTPEPEWDGKNGEYTPKVGDWKEGELPADGTKCEAVWEDSPDGGTMGWQKVTYKRGFDYKIWFSHNTVEIVIPCHCVTFRPIQTPRERVIEKAFKVIQKQHKGKVSPSEMCFVLDVLGYAYDAGMLIEGEK